jgi:uncharacterized RmlC-like cupin family protein
MVLSGHLDRDIAAVGQRCVGVDCPASREDAMEVTANGTKAAIIRGGKSFTAEQGSDYQPGVSAEMVGSEHLFLGQVTLPPGRRTKAHVHERHETAMYMISGEPIDLYSGRNLEHHELISPGDYFYIPANVLHVAG